MKHEEPFKYQIFKLALIVDFDGHQYQIWWSKASQPKDGLSHRIWKINVKFYIIFFTYFVK